MLATRLLSHTVWGNAIVQKIELAVAWVLRRPEDTAAIVGARRPAQIREIAPAADRSLQLEEIQQIESILQERQALVAG